MEIEPDLSICTVAGRKLQGLRGLLTSIQETADPVSVELLVAETETNGAAGLADDFPGLVVTRLAGLSPVVAANQLLRRSRGRYAAVVDSDVIVRPLCLKRLIDFMDDTPEVGLAGPRVIDAYGKTAPSLRAFPSPLALLGLTTGGRGSRPRRSGEIEWTTGGFHLLRRELLDEIGLLDEACPALAELDLYWRAKRRGWHAWCVFEAEVVHANPGRYLTELATADHRPGLGERLRCLKKRWLG